MPGQNNQDLLYAYSNNSHKAYKSLNKGAVWNATGADLPASAVAVYGMAMTGDYLNAFTSEGTYSTADGSSWQKLDNTATGGMNMRSLVFSEITGMYYAACGKRIYTSIDMNSWTQLGNELPELMGQIAFHNGNIYTGNLLTNGKVYKLEL